MKDQEFFLKTEFGLHNVQEHLAFILKSGWVIKTKYHAMKVNVTVYENDKERKQKNHMCKASSASFERALVMCFIKIQDYYRRVLA